MDGKNSDKEMETIEIGIYRKTQQLGRIVGFDGTVDMLKMRLDVGICTTFFSRTNRREYRRAKEEGILEMPQLQF